MSVTTSSNGRSRRRTDTTVPPGYRRIVRAAPATRGGHRKAGTARPAPLAESPRRRAVSAKQRAGVGLTGPSIAPGCDSFAGACGYRSRPDGQASVPAQRAGRSRRGRGRVGAAPVGPGRRGGEPPQAPSPQAGAYDDDPPGRHDHEPGRVGGAVDPGRERPTGDERLGALQRQRPDPGLRRRDQREPGREGRLQGDVRGTHIPGRGLPDGVVPGSRRAAGVDVGSPDGSGPGPGAGRVPPEHGGRVALGDHLRAHPRRQLPAGLLPVPPRRRERIRLARTADRARRRKPRAVPHGQRGVRVAGLQRIRRLLAVLRPGFAVGATSNRGGTCRLLRPSVRARRRVG